MGPKKPTVLQTNRRVKRRLWRWSAVDCICFTVLGLILAGMHVLKMKTVLVDTAAIPFGKVIAYSHRVGNEARRLSSLSKLVGCQGYKGLLSNQNPQSLEENM